ncbi:hypothetical protein MSPP1_003404 [Malassezia sp. CBS 17886]|nr:hypothetical protein MSPP1_003404 [Malassezia sp. CBS 17886]
MDIGDVADVIAALPATYVDAHGADDAGAAVEARTQLLASFTPLLAELKERNRAAYERLAERQRAVRAARDGTDAASVALQELAYEREQLARQLVEIEMRPTVFEQVPLRPLSEYEATAPDAYKSAAVMQDAHALTVHRLQYELDECRRLEQAARTGEQELSALRKRAGTTSRALARLDRDLHALVQTATATDKVRLDGAEGGGGHKESGSKDA